MEKSLWLVKPAQGSGRASMREPEPLCHHSYVVPALILQHRERLYLSELVGGHKAKLTHTPSDNRYKEPRKPTVNFSIIIPDSGAVHILA